MPRIEEFPVPAQAEYADRQRETPRAADERSPVGLFRRLASGLTRRDDETSSLQPARPREPALRPAQPEARRPETPSSIYAPRRDESGRVVAAANTSDDEMLEIPAFLRRHAN
jgi:cell division protein FtsZ